MRNLKNLIKFLTRILNSLYGDKFPGFNSCLESYYSKVLKWAKHEGTRNAIVRAKSVHHAALCDILGQPDPKLPNLGIRNGWPRAAMGLRRFTKTEEGKRAVLTALTFYRGIVVPGEPDLDSITRAGVPVSQDLINEIVEGVKPLPQLDKPEYHFTSKHGPNGLALQSATLDALALKADPSLDKTLKDFLKLQNCDSIALDLEMTQMMTEPQEQDLRHSILAVKQESGGKVRVFATCDYYSQVALKPLHKAVARRLSQLPNDFTWNQEGIVDWLSAKKEKGVKIFHSIDLSSATDRFPALLQKEVVSRLISVPFSELWYDLMTNRDFTFRKEKYRYSVGQPMGAYSSWPVFAFTHHLVVGLAAKRAKISNPEYAIVGDDIVIVGDELSREYHKIITELGVSISAAKSISGNCMEFCKRIWSDRQEISPIPVKLLLQSNQDYKILTQLSEWLYTRGVPKGIRNILLPELLPKGGKRPVALLALSAPWITHGWTLPKKVGEVMGEPTILANGRWPRIPSHILEDVVWHARLRDMTKVSKGMLNIVEKTLGLSDFETFGAPGISAGNLDFLPIQRVVKLLPKLAENSSDVMRDFADKCRKNLAEEIPKSKIFDPEVLLPSNLKSKKSDLSFVLLVWRDIVSVYQDQVFIPDLEIPDTNAQLRALLKVSQSKQTGLPQDGSLPLDLDLSGAVLL